MYQFFRNLMAVVCRIIFRVEKDVPELPVHPIILCANHLSVWDPVILAICYRKPIRFMGKKELFRSPIMRAFFNRLGVIEVDRQNVDLKAMKTAMRVLKEGQNLGIFPEGTRVKKIEESNMKDGIAMIAFRTGADVYTYEITGRYRLFGKIKIQFKGVVPTAPYLETDSKDYHAMTLAIYRQIYGEMI